MADDDFVDSVGLGMRTMFTTLGQGCADNFDTVLRALRVSSTENSPTKALLIERFRMWCTCVDADLRVSVLKKHCTEIYDIIAELASSNANFHSAEGEYCVNVYVAKVLAESVSTVGRMDASQQLFGQCSPLAYQSIAKILASTAVLKEKSSSSTTDTPETLRTDVVKTLMRTLPFSGTVELGEGFKIALFPLLTQEEAVIPASLRADATLILNTLMVVAKNSVIPFGNELLQIARETNNMHLLMNFVTSPEMYAHAKAAVVENLDLFLHQNYLMYASIFLELSNDFPQRLVSHLEYFVNQLSGAASVSPITLSILANIACVAPNDVFDKLPIVLSTGYIPKGESALAKLLGALGKANLHDKAAETVLPHLVDLLESPGAKAMASSILAEIANIVEELSSVDAISAMLPRISKYRSASESAFLKIDDIASRRVVPVRAKRIDAMEQRIDALNKRVIETCSNLSEVIAFVGEHMADTMDFLSEGLTIFPNPHRLEFVSQQEKNVLLYFRCCHTGYDYRICSGDWEMWLRLGFILVIAGQADLYLGVDNPLGMAKKGVECVEEIYKAFNSNGEKAFNKCITRPFLTLKEKDQLLQKLRDQEFFDVFACESRTSGWYLLHPEKDRFILLEEDKNVADVDCGNNEDNQDDCVVEETVGTSPKKDIEVETTFNNVENMSEEGIELHFVEKATAVTEETVPTVKQETVPTPAEAVNEDSLEFRTSPVLDRLSFVETLRQEKVGESIASTKRLNELESKMAALEERVVVLSTEVDRLKAQGRGCACVIC